MKKTELIAMLNIMKANAIGCARVYGKDNNERMESNLLSEASAYDTVIGILTDKKFAQKIVHAVFDYSDKEVIENILHEKREARA